MVFGKMSASIESFLFDNNVGSLEKFISKTKENDYKFLSVRPIVIVSSGQSYLGIMNYKFFLEPIDKKLRFTTSSEQYDGDRISYETSYPSNISSLRKHVNSVVKKVKSEIQDIKVSIPPSLRYKFDGQLWQ